MNSLTKGHITGISAEAEAARRRYSIVGNSAALLSAIERAVKVAPIDLSVLISGESGSGKEFFPKIIHDSGARKHNKYIAVNCGAIPEGTIDSELFGHEKGSFTGAVSSRKGYFEEVDGGTIFLDEVAELPLTTQARLLRVLETGEYLKVGSSELRRTDVRIVAATNVDLPKAVSEGRFREDLYYRLSTVTIQVPPLRDRGSDIDLLARKFAADFSERYLTPPVTLADDARRLLSLYSWPGNVRQLKNVIEQISLFEAGHEIDATTLQNYLPERQHSSEVAIYQQASYERERELLWQTLMSLRAEIADLRSRIGDTPQSESIYHYGLPAKRSLVKYPYNNEFIGIPLGDVEPQSLEDSEREAILRALERNGGVRKKAASELHISERTLYRKIREYGLEKK